MTALKQRADLQLAISQLEEVKDEYDMNQSQSQTVFQDLISKMNQDIKFIQSTLDWMGSSVSQSLFQTIGIWNEYNPFNE